MTDQNNTYKRDLIIQAGMQAIPYVGGSLSTLYFGTKQEKRFKRLETFYDELKSDIEKIRDDIPPLEEQDSEAFEAILEEINEKVERETKKEKIELIKGYFLSTLQNPITDDFDERKYFLDILSEMTMLECEVLRDIFIRASPIKIRTINKPQIDQYAIYGAINKLRSYGFLETRRGSFQFNGQQDEYLDDLVFMSKFGKKFITYVKIA